jgi:hypothetical protein
MSQIAYNNSNPAREVAMARRRAQYSKGKAGIESVGDAISEGQSSGAGQVAAPSHTPGVTSREASRMRREAMSTGGKAALGTADRTRGEAEGHSEAKPVSQAVSDNRADQAPAETENASEAREGQHEGNQGSDSPRTGSAPVSTPAPHQAVPQNSARAASLARRQAMSSQGKAGLKSMPAQAAQSAGASASSRDVARSVREQRSKNGAAGREKSAPAGRMRPGTTRTAGPAEDAHWKVGAGQTGHGQTVTGTMVGRSARTTGDESSTCRSVTGTEYQGADVFQEFCGSKAKETPHKVEVTSTAKGNRISGNAMGRGGNVTGNEPGTCNRISGSDYIDANEAESFCDTAAKPGRLGSKPNSNHVTGSVSHRSSIITGDETGANRQLTGTQYIRSANGQSPSKVGRSSTYRGSIISGTMAGRSFSANSGASAGNAITGTLTDRTGQVTGNEPGTCKAVTGTPYEGAEQLEANCEAGASAEATARARRLSATPGLPMTGLQPGVGGKMTGDSRGACERISGTPYVGADHYAEACPDVAVDSNSPDFPQAIDGKPWGQFSIAAPNHASQSADIHSSITGAQFETGHITGSFGLAEGKITGTEEARFGSGNNAMPTNTPVVPSPGYVDGRAKSRITGEGMETAMKITGDDWDRGNSVTGTEGMSATRRNPTRRGGTAMSMQSLASKRNESIAEPTSKVTGGSGNTEKGSLITYSGGARG